MLVTGWTLFKKRWIADFKYQRKVISTAVDWVVALYIFLPAIVIGTIIYVDIWRNIESYWLADIPFSIVIALLFFFALYGRFRSFMLEADILFLFDRKQLYQRFRGWSFLFSLLQLTLYTIVLLLLFLPILVQGYALGIKEVVLLFFILLGYRMTVYILKKLARRAFLRWIIPLALLYVFSINLLSYFSFEVLAFVSLVVFFAFCIWYLVNLIPTKRFYFQEVASEEKERSRYAKWILEMASATAEVEKTPIRLAKRPFFFRKSKRLFRERTPENGLLELLLKGFVRNAVLFTGYLQLIGITLFAIFILPLWGKWLIFIIAILFLQYNSWLKGLFEKLLDQQFFSVIPINKHVREQVWLRFKRWLMVPAISLFGLATIILSLVIILGGA